jgi:hypothetical protein
MAEEEQTLVLRLAVNPQAQEKKIKFRMIGHELMMLAELTDLSLTHRMHRE